MDPHAARVRLGRADARLFADRLGQTGRVQIHDFFDSKSAERLYACLKTNPRWNLVTRLGGDHRDLDASGMARQDSVEKARFLAAVHAAIRADGFQYLFANIPIYVDYHRGAQSRPLLDELFEFMNSPAVLDFARTLTGDMAISFADAQATRYTVGHFLSEHDDQVHGKNRRAAYVINLSPVWRADWGGLTTCIGADGHIEEAFEPSFSAITIFCVPQPHAVSVVAPFAPFARYAITGWFRAGEDPGQRATMQQA